MISRGQLSVWIDGVVKSPPSCVAAFFQDFDIQMYAFTPEKMLRLGGRNFYLAIAEVLMEAISTERRRKE
jgi:hypothetical protein